ncbi:helix-turn-helix transcriptional regulator [Actinocorallia longicatena]|uniref:HTH cro/C1-type domain-containing protein n=1 Tax=Actinocorallia longicatena TaxID=111803 RepID=A0ABP6QQI4_9ACTN
MTTKIDGEVIRARRRALGLSQASLARRVGLDQPSISRLEKGEFVPPVAVLDRVAAALRLRLTIRFDPLDGP